VAAQDEASAQDNVEEAVAGIEEVEVRQDRELVVGRMRAGAFDPCWF
jgi:hypothetical protein